METPSLNEALALLPSLLPYATAAELDQLERDLSWLSPAAFAQVASQGRWTPARHLSYLDQAITESIDEAERGQLEGLVVSMPPQHGKSELCSKYLPAWYLGRHPDRRVILCSYEADFAASWGRKARDLLEQHGHLFGVQVNRRSGAANRWDLQGKEGGMTAAGVGGPITGKGAHLLIIDDPIKNDEEARSSTMREKQWDWWQSVATTRLRPGALIVVIQTRWHRDDLTGRILAQARDTGHKWRVVKFPALAEEHDALGRQPGEALWPEVFSAERLGRVRESHTNYYWASLYQQNPQAEGSAEWPDHFFGPDIWFNEWPREWICKVVALDPSKGTESKFGDYSAFALVLIDKEGTLYVDADLDIRNTSLIAEQAVEIQRTFQPDWFGCEVNQFQELLAQSIDRRSVERGTMMSIFGLRNDVNKLVRIRRLTPWLPLWWDGGTLEDLAAWRAARLATGAKGSEPFVASLQAGRESLVFSRHTLRKRFRTACRVLGTERLKSLTIHHGRHTFISHALAGGRTLAEVRDAAGHSNVSITSGYIHMAVEDQAVGALFE